MSVRAVLPSDDGALARACVEGDAEAFALLYRRYFPDLVRFLERRGNDHARAEDIAQETLARAFRYLPGFDASRPLWPWLRTIAVRVAGSEAAARSAEVLVCDAPDAASHDPADALAARDVLVESLRRLPDRHRDALVMRYVEDRHPADIAAVLGMNKNSFEQLLWRARRGLAREYGRLSGAVLVPLSLRLRRAAYWADARVSAAFSDALASAGSVAVGAAVVVTSLTAATATSPPVQAALGVASDASADAPSLASVGSQTRRSASTVVTTPPQVGRTSGNGEDIVVERQVQVGPGSARAQARTASDPTRKGTVHENRRQVDAPAPIYDGHTRVERTGGSTGLICNVTGFCHYPRP